MKKNPQQQNSQQQNPQQQDSRVQGPRTQPPWTHHSWGRDHHWLLILWVVIGLWLRFHNLSLKPLWADECSTLVFSLGHRFHTVPLDHLISAEQLLAPLQINGNTTPFDAVQGLLADSNHPPLYFALAHMWMDLGNALGYSNWGYSGLGYSGLGYSEKGPIELVSIGFARALSAGFGILAIPITYWLSQSLWRSPHAQNPRSRIQNPKFPAVAHFAALLMALSPFGIYLSQEARHYTLTVIWILASLACLVSVMRYLYHRRSIPVWLILAWVGCNGLGLATHYFFSLTLLAEAVVFATGLILFRGTLYVAANGWRIGAIALGTIASGAVWLPFLLAIQRGDELTRWIQAPAESEGLTWINPLLNTVASGVTMFYLLPVQGVPSWVAIASGLTVTVAIVVTVVMLKRLVPQQLPALESIRDDTLPLHLLPLHILLGVIASAIAIMWGVTYGLGMDISQAFRYHFVYWPAMMWVGAWGLAKLWHGTRLTRATVFMVLSLALCGAITVSANLGYQKVHRPDQVVKVMAERSHHPLVVAISHQSHGQTGRLMALAWAMQRYPDWLEERSPQFFLDHQPCDRAGEQNCNAPSARLRQTLGQLSDRKSSKSSQSSHHRNAYDLWLINYRGQTNLKAQRCKYRKTKRVDGYKAQHYVCAPKE